jgi:hypothetical protein
MSVAASASAPWKDDRAVEACERCKLAFNMLRRRHHCRRCGGLFCHACSAKKMMGIKGYSKDERICLICTDTMTVTGGLIAESGDRLVHKASPPLERKVCVLGMCSTVRAAMLAAFLDSADSMSLTTSTAQCAVKHGGVDYSVTLTNAAGSTPTDAFLPAYTIGTHAYLLVFSTDDRDSFKRLASIRDHILDCGGADDAVVLVAHSPPNAERTVSAADARAMSSEWKAAYRELPVNVSPGAVADLVALALSMMPPQ